MEKKEKILVNADVLKGSIFMVSSFLLTIAIYYLILLGFLGFNLNFFGDERSTAFALTIMFFVCPIGMVATNIGSPAFGAAVISVFFTLIAAVAFASTAFVAAAISFAVAAATIAITISLASALVENEKEVSFLKTFIFFLFCLGCMGICFYFLFENKTTITTIGLVLLVISSAIPLLIGGGDLLCQLAGRKSFFCEKE